MFLELWCESCGLAGALQSVQLVGAICLEKCTCHFARYSALCIGTLRLQDVQVTNPHEFTRVEGLVTAASPQNSAWFGDVVSGAQHVKPTKLMAMLSVEIGEIRGFVSIVFSYSMLSRPTSTFKHSQRRCKSLEWRVCRLVPAPDLRYCT